MASIEVNLSRSHISENGSVDHVQGIKELVDAGLAYVPHKYIRPPQDRPCLSQVSHTEQVPIIDLAGFFGENRWQTVQQIGSACKEWGFFQVVNHGVSQSAIETFWAAARRFFEQPAEERMRYYSEDFRAEVAYSTSYNWSKEKFSEWKDSFFFRCIPGRFDGFKQAPNFCRDAVLDYMKDLRILAANLYEAIFESLGLSPEYLKSALPGIPREYTAINYYPPCPDPSLVFGLSGHSDVTSITLLLQDKVGGLQVKKGNKWVAVESVPEAILVNVGDQIQLLTNGEYKSIEHRAVVNTKQARMSIACFFGPLEDALISPLPALVDEKHPPVYKPTVFRDYTKNFYGKGLDGKSSIDFSKIE